jgi:hypothetical protein
MPRRNHDRDGRRSRFNTPHLDRWGSQRCEAVLRECERIAAQRGEVRRVRIDDTSVSVDTEDEQGGNQ